MCANFQELMARYAKGKLAAYEASLVEFHLEMCDECRTNVARMTVEKKQRQDRPGWLPRLLGLLVK